MRSYRKCYRTSDFKTVFDVAPPGYGIANPGENAGPGDLAVMEFKIDSLFKGTPFNAVFWYNVFASAPQVLFVDQGSTPGDCTTWIVLNSFSGLTFANSVFDLQFYMDHGLN